MAEWVAYADETGTQDDSQYCAVLGYVASPRQWKLFKRDWRPIVGKDKELHAQKFFQRASWQSSKSPYHGWSGQKARAHLDKLLDVIHRYQIKPIGHAFNIADFRALSLEECRRLTGAVRRNRVRTHGGKAEITSKLVSSGAPTDQYFLGFHYFVTEALKAAPPDVTVSFVFDQRLTAEGWAQQTFSEIATYSERPDIKNRLGLLSFGNSVQFEPLQAADLYAYVLNRWLHDSLTEPLGYALKKLTRKRKGIGIADAAFYRRLIESQDVVRTDFVTKALGDQL